MPELPEVETIRRGLAGRVVGKKIDRAEVRCARIVARPSPLELEQRLAGQAIQCVERRGKFLVFELTEYTLLVHLGMTGQLTYWDGRRPDDNRFFVHPLTGLQKARQHAVDKHTHVSLYFTDGNAMHYRDIRQFGKWRLYERTAFREAREFWALGLEPLSPAYRWADFLSLLERRTGRMKSLLLDQRFVAGVGNIYADEALFEARIHPERLAHSLTSDEKKKLYHAIPKVLRSGLKYGGTSFQNYLNADGEVGANQERLKVYGREGEKCRRCGAAILRIVVTQRSSHYCPTCQPKRVKRRA
ncbi:MAG: bifunctional DNA-formamidopyrimidine glycosylase/DNA-(apurinic or apyrimidinic site) lyase [Acidobacteriota bacterium]